MNIGVTALGEVAVGRFATRGGARVGQRIVVTGTLGDAAAGLKLERPVGDPLRERGLKPAPRCAAGHQLAGIANAVIDISDGLLADLAHLTGQLGAEIRLDRLPTSSALTHAVPDQRERWPFQFSGGDYELLGLIAEDAQLPASAGGVILTEIGRITGSGTIECLDENGRVFETSGAGWDHFRS
ncbi:MAG: hypothetical protein LC637_08760 [Xanthomonadaceae bacterium]|nr:hypothetical protein [Xanthomonadaceae bacterium]